MQSANFRLTRFKNGRISGTAALTERELQDALVVACGDDPGRVGEIIAGVVDNRAFELRCGDVILFTIDKILRS